MQAWNNVKVINSDSLHAGRAGQIVRVEKKGADEFVFVSLDESGTVGTADYKPCEEVSFIPAELQLL